MEYSDTWWSKQYTTIQSVAMSGKNVWTTKNLSVEEIICRKVFHLQFIKHAVQSGPLPIFNVLLFNSKWFKNLCQHILKIYFLSYRLFDTQMVQTSFPTTLPQLFLSTIHASDEMPLFSAMRNLTGVKSLVLTIHQASFLQEEL